MALQKITMPAFGGRFLAAVFAPIFLLLFSAVALAGGRIESLSGGVQLRAKGASKWEQASKGRAVSDGDAVRTGPDGRALLRFIDGSAVSVGNSSELEIGGFSAKNGKRTGLFTLSTGKMRAAISKFSGATDIKVKTPTATAGVKGTDFVVLNNGAANVIFGNEGTVEVRGDNAGAVPLSAATMTENTKEGPPIEPVAVEPGGALDQARTQLLILTDPKAPVEWDKSGLLPEMLARWNINYGHYLSDALRFKESLEVLRIAIDLSSNPRMKAESLLARGAVLARGLNDPEGALSEYERVLESYGNTPSAENALYSSGMIRMTLGQKQEALSLFRRYLSTYPEGAHREAVRTFIESLEKE